MGLTKFCCQHLVWVLAVMFLWSACGDDGHLDPVEPEALDHVIYTRDITFQDAVDYMKEDYHLSDADIEPYEREIAAARLLARPYRAHAIAYHTVTPDGQPVVASGVVYYPRRGSPRGLIEVSPVNKSKRDCATRAPLTTEALPGLLGYALILPDLVGCGESDDLPICYMQHDNVARVSADMRRAAAELVRNEYGTDLPSESVLWGYSLGGSATWALARYYAQHPELGVTVTDVYAGGGAYDPALAVEAFALFRLCHPAQHHLFDELLRPARAGLHTDLPRRPAGELRGTLPGRHPNSAADAPPRHGHDAVSQLRLLRRREPRLPSPRVAGPPEGNTERLGASRACTFVSFACRHLRAAPVQ